MRRSFAPVALSITAVDVPHRRSTFKAVADPVVYPSGSRVTRT
jgi:hypothetical protein